MTGQMSGTSITEDAPNTMVSQLREQLEGKDELIAALVSELEQVVEQLDRAKRNGDRPRPGGATGGLPAEVVEEHQQVLADLQRVVQQWEELQAVSTFGRIESELSELRSMMSKGALARHDRPSTGPATDLDGVLCDLAPGEEQSDDEPTGVAWEAMKRRMLGDGPEPEEESAPAPVTEDLTQLLDGFAAPAPIDLESASAELLKRACAERDGYIVQLIRWIRARRSVKVPDDWDEFPSIPEELKDRVEELASRLEEQVRLAEVEMSLERARISREKSQLQSDKAIMEKHLKRLGISSLDELEDIAVSSSSSGDRRWMRFLGVNRKS